MRLAEKKNLHVGSMVAVFCTFFMQVSIASPETNALNIPVPKSSFCGKSAQILARLFLISAIVNLSKQSLCIVWLLMFLVPKNFQIVVKNMQGKFQAGGHKTSRREMGTPSNY